MEITINGKVYNVEKLDNGKWALPQEVKEALTITCSALNIEGNRVGTEKMGGGTMPNLKDVGAMSKAVGWGTHLSFGQNPRPAERIEYEEKEGRYPAQTFVDSQVAEKLDLQSGVSGGGSVISNADVNRKGLKADAPAFNSKNSGIDVNKGQSLCNYGDIGGCSKILHKCDYEAIDFDLFIYEPKVSGDERNKGVEDFENQSGGSYNFRQDGSLDGKIPERKNVHPTVKPIDLNCKILKLFKTPNEQRICYPFAGSGSEIIGGLKANFQNWTACEINPEYVKIANARIKHYKENEYVQIDLDGL